MAHLFKVLQDQRHKLCAHSDTNAAAKAAEEFRQTKLVNLCFQLISLLGKAFLVSQVKNLISKPLGGM
jgi:hypothetical protein